MTKRSPSTLSSSEEDSQLELLGGALPNGVATGSDPLPLSGGLKDFLALAARAGIGRASLGALIDQFRPLELVWDADPSLLASVLQRAGNRNAINIANHLHQERSALLERAESTLGAYRRARISVLFRDDPAYPQRLRAASGPAFIFVQGSTALLHRKSLVAVVGTRTPTERGLRLAHSTARVLCDAGFGVVSGLAEGIDTEAHQTVAHRGGETLAVLGNGLAVDFPASNRELRREILLTGGALISEYLPLESYSKSSFVQRNRIIAALSGVVIPVEGKASGGTAHTVRFAREIGRPLAGVTDGPEAGTEPPDSIVQALRDSGAPVFRIGEPDGSTALLEFLAPINVDVVPPKSAEPETIRPIYQNVLRQLNALVHHRQPGTQEQEWLLGVIRRILEEAARE